MIQTKKLGARRLKLYIASPLFSDAEQQFNVRIASRLGEFFDVYLPQRDGGLMAQMIKKGMAHHAASHQVFFADVQALDNCDILLAVLDGHSVDEGVAFELGFTYANGKECYGLVTDARRQAAENINPMMGCSLRQVFHTVADLLVWARQHTKRSIPNDSLPELLEHAG